MMKLRYPIGAGLLAGIFALNMSGDPDMPREGTDADLLYYQSVRVAKVFAKEEGEIILAPGPEEPVLLPETNGALAPKGHDGSLECLLGCTIK